MDIKTLIDAFETVLREYAGLGYFIDLLLKSFFVLVLLVLAGPFTKRFSASIRHLIWCVGFFSLFVLPFFIGFLPKIQVPITTPETIPVERVVTSDIVSIVGNLDLLMAAWWNAFVGIYFVLLGIQLLYILLGLFKVTVLSRSAQSVNNPLIHAELDKLVLVEGVTVSVSLKKSKEIFSPVSWGLFLPEIILPEQAEDWDIEKTRNVLIHELGHIQRLDWLTTLIVRITRAIYWFNPLVWYASRKLHDEAEQACDDAVILNGRCHNAYASDLLEIADHARLGKLDNMLVQAITGSPLGSRVFSILDKTKKRQRTELDWVVRGILVGFTVIAVLASLRLVPIVNVTSIDPNVSTAFSVIFIPRKEENSQGGYVEKFLQEINEKQQRKRESRIVQQESNREPGNDAEQVAGTPVQESVSPISEEEDREESGPSLLEEYREYMAATSDEKNSHDSFELYVNQYTSEVTRNVLAAIEDCEAAEQLTDNRDSTGSAPLVAIKKRQPEYPKWARSRGLEGYSVVEYAISSNGEVIDPTIVESKPKGVFNRTSLRAIREYLFEPPEVNGEVVSVQGLQTKFVYQLKPG